VKLRFSNRQVEAQPGDTVAAALYRAGQRIFTRSFKFHRPRGLMCCAGKCPNCLMNVDGVPNVRTCVTPVRDGMTVRSQNAWPSLDLDFLSAAGAMSWAMPVGWYYKTFTNPTAWHLAEPFIRRAAGLGEVLPTTDCEYEHTWMHTHTAVVGGGRAGIAAALDAAEQGETVTLIDDQPVLGGGTRYDRSAGQLAADVLERLESHPSVTILKNSACFGLYEGCLLGALQRQPHAGAVERLIHVRSKRIVVATGQYEVPLLFENNDLPGVMLSSAALRLMCLYRIAPGKRAVVIGDGARAAEVASALADFGIDLVASLPHVDVIRAKGSKHVSSIQATSGTFACDLAVVCGPMVPDAGLVAQAGGKLTWQESAGAFIPADLPENVLVTGSAAGQAQANGQLPTGAGKTSLVCFCNDVTARDLCDGIAEGFDRIEMLKRYTTSTMGPCQGRMCQLAAIGLCSRETRRAMSETGVTTSRPPAPSISLGALAGPRHHPIRRTPLHHLHEESGAVWLDMGEWRRPRYYNSGAATESERACVEREYRAVRERVGLIDVSTLGKLDVRGPDAGKLLDQVYTHRFSDLKSGRVRYAVMCDEAGILLDDGTISRLDEHRYFVTTTTGNLEFVFQTLKLAMATNRWAAHVTNVTGGLGSMNIAGPLARAVLEKLGVRDLETKSFPYMACRESVIGSVPALLLRIGFVGETGWEIHAPAESAEDLWNTLLIAGAEFGITPFGVEAQRLLRLEKKHVIIGVDTDALTNPYQADLAWVAKLDKAEFSGKTALCAASVSEQPDRLVGFILPGDSVPEDGAPVVLDGRPAGRVTSSRYSPARQAAIGLAWVPLQQSEEGATINVRVRGQLVSAIVTHESFYDPEGARLRQ
jgi:sarcosine oxidase, subunit alpha